MCVSCVAEGLNEMYGLFVDLANVETNIVSVCAIAVHFLFVSCTANASLIWIIKILHRRYFSLYSYLGIQLAGSP